MNDRRPLYAILIAISATILVARIARLDSPDPKSPTPFLSANDRSRWATIRALADDGTYVIDPIIFDARGNRVRGWHTIDLVKHRDASGEEHFYSSKPTLLTTLLAGEYWLVQRITGATLADQPHYVSRLMLVLTNVLPLAMALVLLARLIERLAVGEWTKVFAVAAACFATFLTTFSVTLNNHLTAAISLVVGVAIATPILQNESRAWWRFAAAGMALGFMAANELPALSLLVFAAAGLLLLAPLPTLTGFIPGAMVVAAAALGTNLLAHNDWRTPYAHRKDGPLLVTLPDKLAVALNEQSVPVEAVTILREQGIDLQNPVVRVVVRGDRWRIWEASTRTELKLTRTPEGSRAMGIEVRRHDNWYDYEGSYWQPSGLRGIDRGEPSPAVYAFNVLVGHHGLFSLTPLWLLSAWGCWLWLRNPPSKMALYVAITTLVITLTVLAFYLSRSQIDRNYGGGTCCLRWLLWLTPLWLLTLLPAADRLAQSRLGRGLAIGLLAVSVFSAFYAIDNPWSHPWIYDYWTSMGWIDYQ